MGGVGGHAPAQGEVGVAAGAEQGGVLLAQLADLGQQFQVACAALVGLGPPHPLPHRRVERPLHHRQVGRRVQAEQQAALGVALGRLQHALGHALQLGLGERELDVLVADVLVEGLAQLVDAVLDRLGALALGRRQADAGILEAFERGFQELAIDGVARLDLARGQEQFFVLRQGGGEVLPAQLAGLGGVANGLVGVHVGQQVDRAGRVLEVGVEVVGGGQPARTGGHALELAYPGLAVGQALVAGRLDLLGVLVSREGRTGQRAGSGAGQAGCR